MSAKEIHRWHFLTHAQAKLLIDKAEKLIGDRKDYELTWLQPRCPGDIGCFSVALGSSCNPHSNTIERIKAIAERCKDE